MFRNGGLAAGIGTLLIAAWVSCDNMMVLINLAEKTGKRSYAQASPRGARCDIGVGPNPEKKDGERGIGNTMKVNA